MKVAAIFELRAVRDRDGRRDRRSPLSRLNGRVGLNLRLLKNILERSTVYEDKLRIGQGKSLNARRDVAIYEVSVAATAELSRKRSVVREVGIYRGFSRGNFGVRLARSQPRTRSSRWLEKERGRSKIGTRARESFCRRITSSLEILPRRSTFLPAGLSPFPRVPPFLPLLRRAARSLEEKHVATVSGEERFRLEAAAAEGVNPL